MARVLSILPSPPLHRCTWVTPQSLSQGVPSFAFEATVSITWVPSWCDAWGNFGSPHEFVVLSFFGEAVGGEEQDKLHGWHLHKKEAEFIGEINDMRLKAEPKIKG